MLKKWNRAAGSHATPFGGTGAHVSGSIAVGVVLIALSFATASAESLVAYQPAQTPRIAVPSTIERYTSVEEATRPAAESNPDIEERVIRRPAIMMRQARQTAHTPSGHDYLPVLYSLLVPGAGELSMGHWVRGSVMLALETSAWVGYSNFHDKGITLRGDYEAFADEHWSIDKWIDDHYYVWPLNDDLACNGQRCITTPAQMDSIGQANTGAPWPGFLPWVSRAEDKQHFYENIGKYDWYLSGWDDYDPTLALQDLQAGTALRDEYRSMRKESNDKLKAADRFIYLSILTRVASIIQTVMLVRDAQSDDVGMNLDNHFQLGAQSNGPAGSAIVLQYYFK